MVVSYHHNLLRRACFVDGWWTCHHHHIIGFGNGRRRHELQIVVAIELHYITATAKGRRCRREAGRKG